MSVSDLRTEFLTEAGPVEAVSGVSLDVRRGETLAIVGESGSGKSVTALSLMRLNERGTTRMSGSVTLDGRELMTLSDEAFRDIRGNDIAMIFQEPMTSLNPVLTVGTQIVEAIQAHRDVTRAEARAEALRLLDRVRIPDSATRIDQFPHNFSGGMRQRVMIAMALAGRPKLLIADEPTTALDVTVQAQILELLKELQREDGMAVVFITHDMGVVAELADTVAVMYRGKLVETGASETIFAAPEHPYTRALLASVPRIGAMAGQAHPLRFPEVDRATGIARQAPERRDTVRRDADPVLRVQGLVKRFELPGRLLSPSPGRVHASENVSFDIHAGETLSLVGESGCGKSTTGRAILRLTDPDAGEVQLAGRDVTGADPKQLRALRREMQMIFQDPFASLNPTQRVGASIAEPLLIHDRARGAEARKRVEDLLVRVGLSPEMADRFPHEFSGGQRQRICIARALALEPKVIVADEAVSALDVSVKAEVVNLLMELQETMGLAYLFISHDMAVVERVSHRVAVMYLGEIVEIGPREAVFGDPQHPYTKRLLQAVPVADPSRRGQRRSVPAGDLRSPVRPTDYVGPRREWRRADAGQLVMSWEEDPEWAGSSTLSVPS
nr:ABC transporter ATP-binding protein [Tropicimonas sp. IMCC34011]